MKNVILITIDCCRRDVFGCYGNQSKLAPFIDSLQDKCIIFTKTHSVGPYTKASFPGLLASSYCLEYGWQQNCAKEWVLVSEVLSKNGIATAGFHSNPYLSAYFGWNRGWFVFMDSMKDKVTPEYPYLKGDVINKRIEKWITFHTGGGGSYKPFFLWVHYMDIHEPYIPKREFIDFVDASIQMDEKEMFALYKNVLLKRDGSDLKTVNVLKRLYHAHVREADGYVEQLFEILRKLNLLDDTVIIITSDHGDEFGEHGSLSHDSTMYAELIHVPLMISEPGRKESIFFDTLVSTADIPPTITKLFDINPSENWKGQSLLPTGAYQAGGVFCEAPEKKGDAPPEVIQEVHCYREADLKVIYHEKKESWEMFDLAVDPGELKNIVADSGDANRMKEKIMPRLRRAAK
ncbi:MAG: sulfatase [Pseudomonadota bacterium]